MIEDREPLIHETMSGDALGPENLMNQLRAKREEIANTRDTFLPITGYEDLGLQVQHRLMDRPEVEKIGRKVFHEVKNRGERQMRILVDQIIQSTIGFYIQREEDDEPVQLSDENNGDEDIERWDQMAAYLGWDPNGNARSALYYVFGGNEFAVGQYGILLNRWMGNTGLNVDEALLGEGV